MTWGFQVALYYFNTMAPHTTSKKAVTIDPVKVCVLALKQIKSSGDYHQIGSVNPAEVLATAWGQLTAQEQQKITGIVNTDTPTDAKTIADELMACGTRIELKSVKGHYGELMIKQAWKLLPQDERDHLTSICKNEITEDLQPVTEEPAVYKLETQPRRSLFNISDDLERLNDLLDEVGDDSQQQQLINDWLVTLGDERDQKLDNYSAMIVEMTTRAAARKAEAQRLMELAATDENRAKLLRDRLKCFFQLHDLKTVDTARYRLSLAKNGGKPPLVLDESVPAAKLPEQFQRVSIDSDTTAIREALERGEHLNFAHLGERGTNLKIK